MAYVITRTCCNDAACVSVCPVNCTTRPDEPAYATAEMLYIDPQNCQRSTRCARLMASTKRGNVLSHTTPRATDS